MSYEQKHNEANGEENRDGADDNDTWNCGAEGPDRRCRHHRAARAAEAQLLVRADVRPGLAHDLAAAMSSAARSRATTTPTARTTSSPGITGISTSAARRSSISRSASSSTASSIPNFHRYAFYDNDPDAEHPDKNIVWFRADGKRMGAKDWEDGGWMRTLGMFLNGTAPEIRDSDGQLRGGQGFPAAAQRAS